MTGNLEDTLKQLVSEVGRPQSSAPAPWTELFRDKRYDAALPLIEAELTESEQPLAAKLWWVRCQLLIGKVPFMALTAPLEESYDAVRATPELRPLALQTYVEAAANLSGKKQYRISIHLLEKALYFLPAGESAGSPLKQSMYRALSLLISEEILRAEASRESKPYLRSLAEKLTTYQSSATAPVSEKAEPVPPEATPIARARDQRRFALVFTSLAAAVAAALYFLLTEKPDSSLETRTAIRLDSGTPAEVVPPPLQPVLAGAEKGTHEIVTQLRGVGDRLKNIGSGQQTNDSSGGSEINQDALAANFQPESSTTTTIPPAHESTSFGDIKPTLPPAEDKTPPLDPEHLANRSVEVVGDSHQKVSVDKLEHDSSGRVYGPPRDTPEEAEGVKDKHGNPVKSYPVDKFESPHQFRTLTPTDVLSQPSYVARPLARLDRGATVDVVSRMGEWLEIRSAAGRVGYILAQDASEVR